MNGDAAVGAQHIVHMQFPDTLLRFSLEAFGVGRKVCIFIAEQLIRDLAGKNDLDVCMFMNPFADQIHTDRGPDSCDIPGSKCGDHRFESVQHILFCHDDFMMVAVDVVSHLTGIFQVNGIDVHTDGKGL